MGKRQNAIVKGAVSTQGAVTTQPANVPTTASEFRATPANSPHMTDAMRTDVNARDNVSDRVKIVAYYEKLATERDTLSDNQQKGIRRALRSHGFRISSYTKTASNAMLADAVKALVNKA